MSQHCLRGPELADRLISGLHWSEEQKVHFLACECCQRAVNLAVDRRRIEDPNLGAQPMRTALKRKMQRARQSLQQALGIELTTESPAAKAS